MITRVLLFLSLIVLLISIFLPVQSHAAGIDQPHLNLQAEAEIQASPDFIRLNIQIAATDAEADTAKKQVDEQVQQVLALTQRFHIQAKHIEASQISIHPAYRWKNNERQLQGQKVSREINIKLYQLDQYSAFINELSKVKITRYQQRGFGFDDLAGLQTQALLKALGQSQIKAQLIADKLQRKLGKVYQVSEAPMAQHFPMARSLNASAAADESSHAPLEVKPQTIKSKVNVIYLLK